MKTKDFNGEAWFGFFVTVFLMLFTLWVVLAMK
jgi:hypothetical protein